jgi:hypothetical protein
MPRDSPPFDPLKDISCQRFDGGTRFVPIGLPPVSKAIRHFVIVTAHFAVLAALRPA